MKRAIVKGIYGTESEMKRYIEEQESPTEPSE